MLGVREFSIRKGIFIFTKRLLRKHFLQYCKRKIISSAIKNYFSCKTSRTPGMASVLRFVQENAISDSCENFLQGERFPQRQIEINFWTTILIGIQNYFLLTGPMYGRHVWRPRIWLKGRVIYYLAKICSRTTFFYMACAGLFQDKWNWFFEN